MPMGQAHILRPSTQNVSLPVSLTTLCLTCRAQLFIKFLRYLQISKELSNARCCPQSFCTQLLILGMFLQNSPSLTLCLSSDYSKILIFLNLLTSSNSGKLYKFSSISYDLWYLPTFSLSLLQEMSSPSTAMQMSDLGAARMFLNLHVRSCVVMTASIAHLDWQKQIGVKAFRPSMLVYSSCASYSSLSSVPLSSCSSKQSSIPQVSRRARGTSILKTMSSWQRWEEKGGREKRGEMQWRREMLEMLYAGMIWQGTARWWAA